MKPRKLNIVQVMDAMQARVEEQLTDGVNKGLNKSRAW